MLEKDPTILIVGEASTGAGAMNLVHELQPDILVLDIEMPDMKGYDVAHRLRADLVSVTILALSACEDDHFIQAAMQYGIDGYLSKSEAPSQLHEQIHCLLEEQLTMKLRSASQPPLFNPRPQMG